MEQRFFQIRHEYDVPPYKHLVLSITQNVENVRKDPTNCDLFTLVSNIIISGLKMGAYSGIGDLAQAAGEAIIDFHSVTLIHEPDCLFVNKNR